MVLALAGDSTMTRFGPPPDGADAPLADRALRTGAFLTVVFFLAGSLASSVFFRAATWMSSAGPAGGCRQAGVVLLGRLATITTLVDLRLSPILYPFDGCQAWQRGASQSGSS